MRIDSEPTVKKCQANEGDGLRDKSGPVEISPTTTAVNNSITCHNWSKDIENINHGIRDNDAYVTIFVGDELRNRDESDSGYASRASVEYKATNEHARTGSSGADNICHGSNYTRKEEVIASPK